MHTIKQVNLDFLVVTIELGLIFVFRQNVRQLSGQLSTLGASKFAVMRQKAFVETIEFAFDA